MYVDIKHIAGVNVIEKMPISKSSWYSFPNSLKGWKEEGFTTGSPKLALFAHTRATRRLVLRFGKLPRGMGGKKEGHYG